MNTRWLGRTLLTACAVSLAACKGSEPTQVEPPTSQAANAPNYAMSRDLAAPNTYRTAMAGVQAGAPIQDAFGNDLGTVNDRNPKEFHAFERRRVTIQGRDTDMYWLRGAYTDESVSGFVPGEYVADAGALAQQIDLRVANGNGAPMPVTTAGKFRLQPIATDMGYAGPSDGVCRNYHWYGIRGTYPSGTPYTYLIWSLPNVRAGGLNRAVIRDGDSFQFTDTRAVRTDAYRKASGSSCGESVGWVEWKYVRVDQNGTSFFGWAVSRSYSKAEDVVKIHMEG